MSSSFCQQRPTDICMNVRVQTRDVCSTVQPLRELKLPQFVADRADADESTMDALLKALCRE